MKYKEIIKFIGKKVIVILKSVNMYKGKLWGITNSFESTSGLDEIDLSLEGIDAELGEPINNVIPIRVIK